jgi:cyclase
MSDNYIFREIAPGVWAAIATQAGAAVGNAGWARGLAVDCGFTLAAGRDLRTHAGAIDRLVITHADFDHYGGAQAFADVPILASEQTATTIREVGPGRVADMRKEMATYLDELEEQGAPEWEKEQGRRIIAEVPELQLTPPTETFTGERELDGALVIDCGAAHTASDSVVWFPVERVLYTGDLVGVRSHLNVTRGFPTENWLAIIDRLAGLDPVHVVPGHGEPAGPECLTAARRYIETVVAAAASSGDVELPAEYADWEFSEGWRGNIEALR